MLHKRLQCLQAGAGWLVATHRISEKGIEAGWGADSGQQRLVSRGVSCTPDLVRWAFMGAPFRTKCAVQSVLGPASRSVAPRHTVSVKVTVSRIHGKVTRD